MVAPKLKKKKRQERHGGGRNSRTQEIRGRSEGKEKSKIAQRS